MSDDIFQDDFLTVDRSTLERAANCPHQLALMNKGYGRTAGVLAASGTEVHAALSRSLTYYVESGGNMDLNDLRRILDNEMKSSRTDVMADAQMGFRATFFQWTKFVQGLNAATILMYDGGNNQYASQLARDVEFGRDTVRVTSELDLLVSTESPEVVDEVDYKTGWKEHTIEDIRKSFQFNLHAWLLFEHYPNVRDVRVRVWNTRSGELTRRVVFTREDEKQINLIVRGAIANLLVVNETERGPAWPVAEKCRICPVAAYCDAADRDLKEFEPVAAVDQLVAVEAKASAIRKLLDAHVEKHGDIVTPAKNAYGIGRPRKPRKPSKELYQVASCDESDE